MRHAYALDDVVTACVIVALSVCGVLMGLCGF